MKRTLPFPGPLGHTAKCLDVFFRMSIGSRPVAACACTSYTAVKTTGVVRCASHRSSERYSPVSARDRRRSGRLPRVAALNLAGQATNGTM